MMYKRNFIALASLFWVSFTANAQTSDKYHAISSQLVNSAYAALSGGAVNDARLMFERALVADPANVQALIGLGKAHEDTGNTGKGLKYYRHALEIEPNDQQALQRQALAFLKRDMADRALDNQEKLARLCPKGCEALSIVTTAVDTYLDKAENETEQQSAELSPQG